MAGSRPSISRRRVLGGAAAIPVLLVGDALPAHAPAPSPTPSPSPARRLWERRLARWRRLAAAAEEAAERGWFRAANERYERELAAIARQAIAPGEAAALRRAAFERVDAAEEAYWARCTEPMQKAAVALACTPAPDVAAVREKIGAMRAVRMHELGAMRRDCFAVLEEDLGRVEEAGPGL